MGDQAQARQEKASKGAGAGAPMSLTTGDHTTLVDLLLQEAAQAAKSATAQKDGKELLHGATLTVARVRVALDAYAIPESGLSPKQIFRTVDGAFMGLYDLFYALRDQQDAGIAAYADEVQGAMIALNERFAPVGWKAPKSEVEGSARAKSAKRAGLTSLSISERGKLGRMHIRAARQYLLGAWSDFTQGNFGGAATAAENLHEAAAILIDPHFAQQVDAIASDLETTEQIFRRFVMSLEQSDAAKLAKLTEVARQLDGLRRVVGKEPEWQLRLAAPSPSTSTPTGTPTATQPGQASMPQQPGMMPPTSNDVDRGPPRAEPPMHRLGDKGEMRHWTKKVHIMDTNYTDEYLGYIELSFEAYKTPYGQVYITGATATQHLEDRAGEYLSMGANIVANSIELKGKHFADVTFDIQIGGPNKTETTAIGASAKVTASNSDKSAGGEIGASVVFSTAVTSRGTRSFRRAFRVSGLEKPQKVFTFDPAEPYTPKLVEMGMIEDERTDLHEDFSGFELDDDDVGDTVFSFNANWILHSYSD